MNKREAEKLSNSKPENSNSVAYPLSRYSRVWMATILGISDIFCLLIAGFLAVGLRIILPLGLHNPPFYLTLIPLILVFLSLYVWRGLYPAVGTSPVEELRRLSQSTSIVFIFITAFTFWVRTAETYSRLVFFFAWFFALALVPTGRFILRNTAIRFGLWGEPIAVVGDGPQGKKVFDFLINNLRLGLRPVMLINEFTQIDKDHEINTNLNISKYYNNFECKARVSVKSAVLITSEIPNWIQGAIVEEQLFGFKRLILIPNLHWVGSVGVVAHDLEGFLGLEVRRNLLSNWQQAVKRILDVCIVLIFGLLALPLGAIISMLIRLNSNGHYLFNQQRIGKGGIKFSMLKFRTMFEDADQILENYFLEHPEAMEEWHKTQKLKNDPRITKVGNILRKFSLDELPQFWNVLKGEMSFVGPRPIVEEEIYNYSHIFKLYKQVRPGITGLWQVSGRNDVTYDERVRFDEYYVRNWSVWLDIYILIRTIWAVLRGEGAY